MRIITTALVIILVALLTTATAQSDVVEINDSVFILVNVDPFTDSNSSMAVAEGVEFQGDSRPYGGIGVRCNEDAAMGWEIFAHYYDAYLGSADDLKVQWRFDGGESQQANWYGSNSGESAFLPSRMQNAFLDNLLSSNRLTLATYDYTDTRQLLYIELAGLREAIERIDCDAIPLP